MSGGGVARSTALVFAAALLQAVIVSSVVVGGGSADLLLLVVISFGLLRGSVPGAVAGFAGGLVVDLLTLETLGLTSLVLTLAGFWAGRYGETTARGRRVPPLVAAGVITVLAALFGLALHYMLGYDVDARHALLTALPPALVGNLLLVLPVHSFVRWALREPELEPAAEVEVVV